jgi:hypothetical protein
MDHVMVGNFVTAEQAQRKWYTNVLSKVSAGNYKIGAVRAAAACLFFSYSHAMYRTPQISLCKIG